MMFVNENEGANCRSVFPVLLRQWTLGPAIFALHAIWDQAKSCSAANYARFLAEMFSERIMPR